MKRILFAVIAIITLTAVSCDYDDGPKPSEYTTNEDLICSESFYVGSESTDLDTWTSGTIFLSGENGIVKHAKIVAMVEIDPEDWGGVTITVPKGWKISSMLNSCPEDQGEDPSDFITTWFTADRNSEYNEIIVIGTDLLPPSMGGGTGTVIIELDTTENASTELFQTTIGVGSTVRNGYNVTNPDHKTIEIPLPQAQ